MVIHLFQDEAVGYLHLFGPSFVGLAVTSVGVYRMRNDVNFTGVTFAYTGIILFFGSLFWIYWIFEAFS